MTNIESVRKKYYRHFVYFENLIRIIYSNNNGRSFQSLNSLINRLFRDHTQQLRRLNLTRRQFHQYRMLRNTLSHENGIEPVTSEELEEFSMIIGFNKKIIQLLTELNLQIPLMATINISDFLCNNCSSK